MELLDTDVRAFGFGIDLQMSDQAAGRAERVMPHLRYLNALEGRRQEKWQFKRAVEPLRDIGGSGKTRSHFHLAPTGWEDVPGGAQRLCYNEIATKHNWYYVQIGFDLATMSFTSFRCNDRVFDATGIAPMRFPAMPNLWCMFNPFLFVEADSRNTGVSVHRLRAHFRGAGRVTRLGSAEGVGSPPGGTCGRHVVSRKFG